MSVLEICDVNRRTDVALERAIRQEAWNSLIEYPSVFSIRPAQPALHLKAPVGIKGGRVCSISIIQVLWMYVRRPAASQYLSQCAARKVQPPLTGESARLVDIGTPNHQRCSIRHKTGSALHFREVQQSARLLAPRGEREACATPDAHPRAPAVPPPETVYSRSQGRLTGIHSLSPIPLRFRSGR